MKYSLILINIVKEVYNLHTIYCFTFIMQGDREAELGLPISPLCDRNNTLVAESQIG